MELGIGLLLVVLAVAGAFVSVRRTAERRDRERDAALARVPPPTHPVRFEDRLSLAELAEARAHALAVTEIVELVAGELRPGLTTFEIDARIESEIVRRGLVPAMKGYNGAPCASMIALNEEVLHGVPSRERALRDGDLVTIQTAVRGPRVHAAIGRTYVVGAPSVRARGVIDATESALAHAIDEARVGKRLGDVGLAIESTLADVGLAAVRDYVGYAIGRSLMLHPQIPGYGRAGTGMRLREGMLLNIHVIAKEGGCEVSLDDDRWTVRGAPGELSSLATAMVWLDRDRTEVLTPLALAAPPSDRGA